MVRTFWMTLCFLCLPAISARSHEPNPIQPHIVLVMADDMGWGQTSYRGHPILKTPHLDAMANHGLRFERFYAGCAVCSPTRATVLTGRSNDRTGVLNHGYALRLQEKTVAQALQKAGYVTGHFGKWHLNGYKGPGAPVLISDPRNPGAFGFDEWISVTNFFDVDPLMSQQGKITEYRGDSSEIAAQHAIDFLERHRESKKPMFCVIWFGSPHSPFKSLPEDKIPFNELDDASANHYGELVAMDRSLGTLRAALGKMGIAKNTLLVFCSDNGGLPEVRPDSVGGLRGNKASVYEGGLRVPAIIEWPDVITQPRVTHFPACTTDLFPTIAELVGLPADSMIQPIDGMSLVALLRDPSVNQRTKPLAFRYGTKIAWIDHRYKLLSNNLRKDTFELYDLAADEKETKDLAATHPEIFMKMKNEMLQWNESVEKSFAGGDYPGGKLASPDPESIFWYDASPYQTYLSTWKERWEFKSYIERQRRAAKE